MDGRSSGPADAGAPRHAVPADHGPPPAEADHGPPPAEADHGPPPADTPRHAVPAGSEVPLVGEGPRSAGPGVDTGGRHAQPPGATADGRSLRADGSGGPPPMRPPRAGRTRANRILWALIGAVLLLGGTALALASRGQLGADPDGTIRSSLAPTWKRWDGWSPGVVIAAGLVLAVLGLLLVRAEVRGRGGRTLPDQVVPTTDHTGRTRVAESALRHGLTGDLLAHRRVRRAAVHLTGQPSHPQLYLRLGVAQDADLRELRTHVDQALARFTATSGWRPEVAEVVVSLADGQPQSRVH